MEKCLFRSISIKGSLIFSATINLKITIFCFQIVCSWFRFIFYYWFYCFSVFSISKETSIICSVWQADHVLLSINLYVQEMGFCHKKCQAKQHNMILKVLGISQGRIRWMNNIDIQLRGKVFWRLFNRRIINHLAFLFIFILQFVLQLKLKLACYVYYRECVISWKLLQDQLHTVNVIS